MADGSNLASDLRKRIEIMADHIARNGADFESTVKQKNASNPQFAFLYNGEGSEYYQQVLATHRSTQAKVAAKSSAPTPQACPPAAAAPFAAPASGGSLASLLRTGQAPPPVPPTPPPAVNQRQAGQERQRGVTWNSQGARHEAFGLPGPEAIWSTWGTANAGDSTCRNPFQHAGQCRKGSGDEACQVQAPRSRLDAASAARGPHCSVAGPGGRILRGPARRGFLQQQLLPLQIQRASERPRGCARFWCDERCAASYLLILCLPPSANWQGAGKNARG
ncbi:unnamed protein product [Effrenium voratum]|nr:unnamed protein product [Effrenium voratum]